MSQYVSDISEANLDDELLQSKVPILVDFWAPGAVHAAPCRPQLKLPPKNSRTGPRCTRSTWTTTRRWKKPDRFHLLYQ